MRNYFADVERWPEGAGALHLYVLPGESPLSERLADAQERIEGIDGLPLQPQPYLHLTLQRLAQFDDQVAQRQLSDLGAALDDALSGTAPFNLTFDLPNVTDRTVECTAHPSREWDELVATVREALRATFGPELPAPPHAPHLSLAYATGEADDVLVAERLARSAPLGGFTVTDVHLVSVTMHPKVGVYSFTTLASWPLGGGPAS